eukprot:11614154-Prorocentrum_lima.AAC.1
MSDHEYEERSRESKIKNKARDVVYAIKQADHDLDVLQVQLGTYLGHSEVASEVNDRVPESDLYPRKRNLIVYAARGMVPT